MTLVTMANICPNFSGNEFFGEIYSQKKLCLLKVFFMWLTVLALISFSVHTEFITRLFSERVICRLERVVEKLR